MGKTLTPIVYHDKVNTVPLIQFIYRKKFKKKFRSVSPVIRAATDFKLRILCKNPYDPILNNHALQGDRQHLRTINITGDIRLVFQVVSKEVYFIVDIDNHNNLYG